VTGLTRSCTVVTYQWTAERGDSILRPAGVENYEFDHCWEDYRFGLFQATVVRVTGAMLALRTKRGDQIFQTMARRSCAAIRELDSLSLV
jgi:hypothetical protein